MTLLTRGGGEVTVAAFLVCALLVYYVMIYVSEGANDFFPNVQCCFFSDWCVFFAFQIVSPCFVCF